ncbi:1-hydroxy-2-methyl-2-(E)-butenyl 4-diphosphate synthase chloroplast precursor [Tribonema minus]|uniref:4-hydroxy-3-methylbut-2-en-1-yl diphosphate synthase (ferredoxin), chloroplastic n=1 Tax=Tribonema minus TaxID=303371 RepID=A0A835YGL0_9STRA|nr:1-hydroxy-2-methyl-2-(E)-butenyl 4-diphosphate synthase chloroplast precursor [Tribonema minus]
MQADGESPILTLDQMTKYCESVTATRRRPTRTVWAGKVPIGSEHRIALQTMTTTDTRNVAATVDQVMRCADAGADLVRITVQGNKEAEAAAEVRDQLFKKNYDIPIVADIHFNPRVAMLVADAFEKIRINPGNFADGRKTFDEYVYESKEEYDAEIPEIAAVLEPLVVKCRDLGRAMRIGTNHGSLSARVLSYYGDTPRGMVESAVEFAEICRGLNYHNFVFSMKASNPLVMVQAYRLLAAEQYRRGWDYPLHLGVTEAGEGEDGRMKSAIGIGALLQDGLGDTIRVSLTEDPEFELEPCRTLANIGKQKVEDVAAYTAVPEFTETTRNFQSFERRRGELPSQQAADPVDIRGVLHRDGSVLSAVTLKDLAQPDLLYRRLGCKLAVGMPFKDIATVDSIFLREVPPADDRQARTALRRLQEVGVGVLAPIEALKASPLPNSLAVVSLEDWAAAGGKVELPEGVLRAVLTVKGTESDDALAMLGTGCPAVFALLETPAGVSRIHAARRVFQALSDTSSTLSVIHHMNMPQAADLNNDQFILTVGSEAGAALVDGLGDGVMIEAPGLDLDAVRTTSFGLLQGSRMRNTKTEYVSCPSCGRTLFDLQEVTQQIQEKTGHLPGVSIAIMGCIVNGVGEMADADFGYVGGAPGKVDLYVGKEMVKRAIPNEQACDALIQLIKDNGRWKEKEVEEEPAEVQMA